MINTEIRLIVFFAAKDGEALYKQQKHDRELTVTQITINNVRNNNELLTAKFTLKWKKVGKTTRPFRCDLNQIPSDYTVEMRNRFKGLDLIERVPDELWMEVHDIAQEKGARPSPRKRIAEKQKGYLRRPYK